MRRERWTLERLRREYTLEVVRRTGERPSAAARALGIDPRTLATRLEQYRYKERGAEARGLRSEPDRSS